MSAPELTLKSLEDFIRSPATGSAATIGDAPPPVLAEEPLALLDAASVLVAFDPFTLRPAAPLDLAERDRAMHRLIAASEPLRIPAGASRADWTLKVLERRNALRRLGTRERMRQVLAANPSTDPSVAQRMFNQLVSGDAVQLAEASREEIAALITAREWLESILDGLPPLRTLQEALAKADVFAPLHRLLAGGFVGRVPERQRIGAHFRQSPDFSPPLFVYGPGGVGKSTLLARCILDQSDSVCAYVDIDRPSVRPEMPLTFLLEIVRQLKTQLEPFDSTRLETLIVDDLNKFESGRHLESVSSFQGTRFHVAELAKLVAGTTAERIVVAIDTFEEAQFLGDDIVEPALEFLFQITESVGAVRMVLSGRALPRAYLRRIAGVGWSPGKGDEENLASLPIALRPLDLNDLSDDDARVLLDKVVGDDTASKLTQDEAEDVIRIVGRNPMSLRLAARLLREGGLKRLRDNAGDLLLELKAEKVQAMLYGRILHHVHKPDVAKIAYPGLVVRRITPEIIREVLAGPCGLVLAPERDEYAIWHDLTREVALVQRDQRDESLRHRVDIRRVMLQDLLDHVERATVAAIDEAAVGYYARQAGAAALAEEIYHRLRRGEPVSTLDLRWKPDVSSFLKDALEDFAEARPRLWLANKLGVTLESGLRDQAAVEEWEEQTARAVERFLASGAPQRALDLLSERNERTPRSRLYALEAETLRFLARPEDALRVARSGVDALSRYGATDAVAELLLKMAAIEESRGNLAASWIILQEVQPIALSSGDSLLKLRALANWTRLDRLLNPENHDGRNYRRDQAAALLTDEVIFKLRKQPVLLRELAAELSSVDRRLAGQAIQTLGLEVTTDHQVKAFAEAVSKLSKEVNIEIYPEIEAIAKSSQQAHPNMGELRRRIETLSADSLREISSHIVASNNDTLKGFLEYFRAGVDNILKSTRG